MPSALALLFLLLAVGGLGLYNLRLRDFNQRLGIEQQETQKQKVAAEVARDEAKENERVAEENAQVAQAQRKLALDALGQMVDSVQRELGKKPGLQDLQKGILSIAMDALPSVAENAKVKVSLKDSTLAAIHFKLGRLFVQSGETEKAAEAFRRAEAVYAAVVKADPDHPDARANQANQAVTLMQLGNANLRLKGQTGAASDCFRKAAELLAPLEQTRPGEKIRAADVKKMRAESLDRLGIITSDTNLREARGYYAGALELRSQLAESLKTDDTRGALAGSYVLLGGADFRLRNPASTQEYYQKAVQLRDELAKAHPDDLMAQREWGFARQRLGEFFLRTGRPELAAQEFDAAARLYQELVTKDPKRADFKDDLSRALYDVATAALRRGDKALAAEKHRAALEIRAERARGREELTAQKDLMVSLARCGEHRRAEEIALRARKQAPDDRGTLYDVACCFAVCCEAVAPEKAAAELTAEERQLRDHYADLAVQALRDAVARGHRDVVSIETDPDFDAIHDRPGFKSLLAELSK